MNEKHSFYIIENVWKTSGKEFTSDIRMLKVPDYFPIREGEGPYESIRNLKRNSVIFKKLISLGSKQVQQV